MDDWEKCNEALPENKDRYIHLKMEGIPDGDYTHTKTVCKDFNMKHLGEYHDLCVQNYTLLLADVLDNCWNMCFEIYGFDPVHFLSAPGLAWQAALKKTKVVKLNLLLTDIYMLLVVEKGIKGEMCHVIHQYLKANNKYMKDYNKVKKSSYLKYWDVNNLYVWATSQKLSVEGFKWVEYASQFCKDFVKNYNEVAEEVYFHKADVQYHEKLYNLHTDLPFFT